MGKEETEQEREEKREEVAGILCDTLGNIGKTCMKELQKCFRREDVVRTTTDHLKSMKGFLINIAENKVVPGALDLCDPVTGIDFGPEEEEEDYMYQEDYESEEVTSEAKEEIRAAIMEKLSEVKKEQQQDQPKDDVEVKAAPKKPNPKLLSSAAVSTSASEKVISVSTLLLVLQTAKVYV